MSIDQKASIVLAHLRLPVSDIDGAIAFFEAMGARPDVRRDGFAVVELRDRTRLQLTESKETLRADSALQFDFKVDDIDAAWQAYADRGLNPSEITRRNPGHDWFVVKGPDGCEIRVNSVFTRGEKKNS